MKPMIISLSYTTNHNILSAETNFGYDLKALKYDIELLQMD